MRVIKLNDRYLLTKTKDINNKKLIDKIFLVQQYYQDKFKIRQKELDYCLQKNLNNDLIKKIYLLNEKKYDFNKFKNNNKIIQVIIKTRLTYFDFFKFIQEKKGYFILANLDIFFDNSLKNIYSSSLARKKAIYCLTRYNFDGNKSVFFEKYKNCSQDVWIVHSNFLKINNYNLFKIELGKPCCDNVLAYILFFREKFLLFNEPKKILCHHYHETQLRNYSEKDKIKGLMLNIEPNY